MLARHSPRSVLLWAGAVLAGLVAAQSAASDLAALDRRANDAGREVAVVVAGTDLALGDTVEGSDLAVERHFEGRLPPRALRSRDAAVGRVVATPVLDGSVVTERHLAPRDRNGLDGALPEGMRGVWVAAAGAEAPPAGAVVDVLVTFDPSVVPEGADATVVTVEGALVLRAADAAYDGGASGVGVLLLVDIDAARRLASAAAHGIVTLALAPPDAASRPPP